MVTGANVRVCTGPCPSIGRPVAPRTRPSTPGPTGTVSGAPVSHTGAPSTQPSIAPRQTARTRESPRCSATSSRTSVSCREKTLSSSATSSGTTRRGSAAASLASSRARTRSACASAPAMPVGVGVGVVGVLAMRATTGSQTWLAVEKICFEQREHFFGHCSLATQGVNSLPGNRRRSTC